MKGRDYIMSAIDELIKYIMKFTPEQLDKFLLNKITLSILRPEEAAGSDHPTTLEFEQ